MSDMDRVLIAIEALRTQNSEQYEKLWEEVRNINERLGKADKRDAELRAKVETQGERLGNVEEAIRGLVGTEHDMRQYGGWHAMRKEAVYGEMAKLGYRKTDGLRAVSRVFPLERDSEGRMTRSFRPSGHGGKNTRAVVIKIEME